MVGKEGELCCTALSSSRSLSSSERLLPRAEVMAADDESDVFCLFGKLRRTEKEQQKGKTKHQMFGFILTTSHVWDGYL